MTRFILMAVCLTFLVSSPSPLSAQTEKSEIFEPEPLMVCCFEKTGDLKNRIETISPWLFFDQKAVADTLLNDLTPFTSALQNADKVFSAHFANRKTGEVESGYFLPVSIDGERLVEILRILGTAETVENVLEFTWGSEKYYLGGQGNHIFFVTAKDLLNIIPQNPTDLIRDFANSDSTFEAAVYPQNFPDSVALRWANGNENTPFFQNASGLFKQLKRVTASVMVSGGGCSLTVNLDTMPGSHLESLARSDLSLADPQLLKYSDPKAPLRGYVCSRAILPLVEQYLIPVAAMADAAESDPFVHDVLKAMVRNGKIQFAASFQNLDGKPNGLMAFGIGDGRQLANDLPKKHQVEPSNQRWLFETRKTDGSGNILGGFVDNEHLFMTLNPKPEQFKGAFKKPKRPNPSIVYLSIELNRLLDLINLSGGFDDDPKIFKEFKLVLKRFPEADEAALVVLAKQDGFKVLLGLDSGVCAATIHGTQALGAETEVADKSSPAEVGQSYDSVPVE